jgi:hypothetical protein
MATPILQQSTVLSSWKDIAQYTGKGVRTVQRWERELGLPVRRPRGQAQKSAIISYRCDIDAWMASHFFLRLPRKRGVLPIAESCRISCGSLRQNMRTPDELEQANDTLVVQIRRAVHLLAEQCNPSTTFGLEVSWCITASRLIGRNSK